MKNEALNKYVLKRENAKWNNLQSRYSMIP